MDKKIILIFASTIPTSYYSQINKRPYMRGLYKRNAQKFTCRELIDSETGKWIKK